jgi:hypothetical protein
VLTFSKESSAIGFSSQNFVCICISSQHAHVFAYLIFFYVISLRIFYTYNLEDSHYADGQDRVVGLAAFTGWTVRGSNRGKSEILRTRSDWLRGPPSLLYNGYRVCFPVVRRQECSFNHPTPFSADFKKECWSCTCTPVCIFLSYYELDYAFQPLVFSL